MKRLILLMVCLFFLVGCKPSAYVEVEANGVEDNGGNSIDDVKIGGGIKFE